MRNLMVVNASFDSLKVMWNAPNDSPPKGILEKFIVRYRPLPPLTGGGHTKHVTEINENSSSLVIRGLASNAAYNISVCIMLQEICEAINFTKTLKNSGFCVITVAVNNYMKSLIFPGVS